MAVRFADRAEAGRALGEKLVQSYRDSDTLVLALPRGGAPVAAEVADALRARWDVFVVRKLGVPGRPELAFGAVASGGIRIVNDDIVARAGLTASGIEAITEREREELAARERRYRGERQPPRIAGRTVILVDDGIATGSSVRAAVDGVRALGPDQVVVAAPVAPPPSVSELAAVADDVVVLATPDEFGAVGLYYRDFGQVSDQDVTDLLAGP